MRIENAPSREEFAKLIATMSTAQLALLYRVAQDIRDYPAVIPDAGDVTEAEPTEEELAAEDAKWDAAFAQTTPEQWAKLHERVSNSPSLPMFDDNGRWLVDDYTDEDFERVKTTQGE